MTKTISDQEKATTTPAWPSWRQWLALAPILILATIVRFSHIGDFSMAMDEIWSIELSMGNGSVHDHLSTGVITNPQDQPQLTSLASAAPWWRIWTHMVGTAHPPLYHAVLRWWMDCLGTGPAATRALSAVVSILGILVLFDICRMLSGVSVGLWVAGIAALAGGSIDLAQLTRNYAMVICFALCCADAMVRIEKLGISKTRLIALAVSLAATALTHYFSAGAIAALGVYGIFRMPKDRRWPVVAALAVGALATTLLWAPWLIQQPHSLPAVDLPWFHEAPQDHAFNTMQRVALVPALLLFGARVDYLLFLNSYQAIAVMTLLVPLLLLWWRPGLWLWVLMLYGTLGFLSGLDLARGWVTLKYFRYIALAGPPVYALLAAFDLPNRPYVRHWLPALVAIVLLPMTFQRVMHGLPAWEEIRQYAMVVDADAKADDLLIFAGSDPWCTPGMICMDVQYYARTPRPWLILDRPASAPLERELRQRRSLWLIVAPGQDGPKSVATYLPGWKIDRAEQVQDGNVFRLVHDE